MTLASSVSEVSILVMTLVVIYDHHRFIIQATGLLLTILYKQRKHNNYLKYLKIRGVFTIVTTCQTKKLGLTDPWVTKWWKGVGAQLLSEFCLDCQMKVENIYWDWIFLIDPNQCRIIKLGYQRQCDTKESLLYPGNTTWGSVTVPLTSCLTVLDKSVLQIK